MKRSSSLILVDVNVLLYALDKSSKYYTIASSFLDANVDKLALSHQTINEYIRVATHPVFPNRLSITRIEDNVQTFLDRFAKIISPNSATLECSLNLIKKYKIVGSLVFDTYLIATVLTNNINTLATFNVKDFQLFKSEGFSFIAL